MRRLFLLWIILACIGTGEGKNPFARYGYPVKVATMSNGKYEEFHDTERYVVIGSVLFDTETQTVAGRAGTDTCAPPPRAICRYISIDPEAERYYSISPYAYCANNPLKYVDKDGKQVVLPAPGPIPVPVVLPSPLKEGSLPDIKLLSVQVKELIKQSKDALLFSAALNLSPFVTFIPEQTEASQSQDQASDSSKNEKHGDGGREQANSEKRIGELSEQLKNAKTKKEKKEIKTKISKIRENGQRKNKGEEHGRGNRR